MEARPVSRDDALRVEHGGGADAGGDGGGGGVRRTEAPDDVAMLLHALPRFCWPRCFKAIDFEEVAVDKTLEGTRGLHGPSGREGGTEGGHRTTRLKEEATRSQSRVEQTLRREDVDEAPNVLLSYLEHLIHLDQEATCDGLESEWSCVTAPASYSNTTLAGEIFSVIASLAVSLTFRARKTLERGADALDDEAFQDCIFDYRKAAGMFQHLSEVFDHEFTHARFQPDKTHSIEWSLEYLFSGEACSAVTQSVLLEVQILEAARVRVFETGRRAKAGRLKLATILLDNTLEAVAHLVRESKLLQHRFPKSLQLLLLGLGYLYRSEIAKADNKDGQSYIYLFLCKQAMHGIRGQFRVQVRRLVRTSDLSGAEAIFRNVSSLAEAAAGWRHRMHSRLLGKEAMQRDFLVSLMSRSRGGAALVLEPVPFDLTVSSSKVGVSHGAPLESKVSTSDQCSQSGNPRLEEASIVGEWKYGIERIREGHHQMSIRASLPSDKEKKKDFSKSTPSADDEVRMEVTKRIGTSIRFKKGEASSRTPDDKGSIRQRMARKRAPSFLKYVPELEQASERVFVGHNKFRVPTEEVLRKGRAQREVAACGLCEKTFLKSNLGGRTTKRAVAMIRHRWGAGSRASSCNNTFPSPALLYSPVEVCLFCEQFFTSCAFEAFWKAESSLQLRADEEPRQHVEETQQDKDVEQMILASIEKLTLQKFHTLTEHDRRGIVMSSLQLKNLNGDTFTNLALKGTPAQSSTFHDQAKFCALSAIDDNIFGNAARTKAEENAWWSVDLKHQCNISSVRIWCEKTHLRQEPLLVALSRTPFDEVASLEHTESQAEIKRLFLYQSRVLEWLPRHEPGDSPFRARYLKIVSKEAISLSLGQVQVLGTPVLELMPSRETSGLKREADLSLAGQLGSSLEQRVGEALAVFQFDVSGWRKLQVPAFFAACNLLRRSGPPTPERSPTLSTRDFAVNALRNCEQAYSYVETIQKLQMSLDWVLLSEMTQALDAPEVFKEFQAKISFEAKILAEEIDVVLIAEWQLSRLKDCFSAACDSIKGDIAKISGSSFGAMFCFGGAGFGFIEECVLLKRASKLGNLHSASEQLTKVNHVQKHGVDWICFALFILCGTQLLDVRRRVLGSLDKSSTIKQRPQSAETLSLNSGSDTLNQPDSDVQTGPTRRFGITKLGSLAMPRPASAVATLRTETSSMLQSLGRRVSSDKDLAKCQRRKLQAKKQVRGVIKALQTEESVVLRSRAGLVAEREPCALCEQKFSKENLPGRASGRALEIQLEEWANKFGKRNTRMPQVVLKNRRSSMAKYDFVKLCRFCNQFFVAKYNPGCESEDIEHLLGTATVRKAPLSTSCARNEFAAKAERKLTRIQRPFEEMPLSFLQPHVLATETKSTARPAPRARQEPNKTKAMSSRTELKSGSIKTHDGKAKAAPKVRRRRKSVTISQAIKAANNPKLRDVSQRNEPLQQAPCTKDMDEEHVSTCEPPQVRPPKGLTVRDFAKAMGLCLDTVARTVTKEIQALRRLETCAYGSIVHHDREHSQVLNPSSWRFLTVSEKIAHIAAIKLQTWQRMKCCRGKYLLRLCRQDVDAVAERVASFDRRAACDVMQMSSFLDQVSEDEARQRAHTYKLGSASVRRRRIDMEAL
ncbi:Uncharacterized protein SCF082_LOCUS10239 [Durusdinium trenchii]|uniref:Uncharacterized protein n=1 Tax=Durusdinium trenchii TaxID=1381693 RepID=A0ABP0J4R8_9DINO